MSLFAKNLILALIWAALMADFSLASLAIGFAVGFAALALVNPLLGGDASYFRKFWAAVRLFGFFYYELIVSSVAVARDVLRITPRNTPAIADMPLDVKSDFQNLLVTNLISLTPGTLSLDVKPDRSAALIHAMFADDPDAVVRDLKAGMETKVREAFE